MFLGIHTVWGGLQLHMWDTFGRPKALCLGGHGTPISTTIPTIKDFDICQMTLKPFSFQPKNGFMTYTHCIKIGYFAKLKGLEFLSVVIRKYFSWIFRYLNLEIKINILELKMVLYPSVWWWKMVDEKTKCLQKSTSQRGN